MASVFTRVRRLLNDDTVAGGRVFTDAYLLQHALNAYDWFFLELSDSGPAIQDFRNRTVDLAYTANTAILSGLAGWPTDLWFPEVIKFRLNTNEPYVELVRVDELPKAPAGANDDRLHVWAFFNRQIHTVPGTQAGFLLMDYIAIPAALTGAASPILADMAVTAMAYYTAFDAMRTRGQEEAAMQLLGRKSTPSTLGYGAAGFMEKVVSIRSKNEQLTERRGEPAHGAPTRQVFPGYFS